MRQPSSTQRSPFISPCGGQRFRGLALAAALAAMLGTGRAGAAEAAPQVNYFPTCYLGKVRQAISFRADFKITGPPQRLYWVTFQLRLTEKEALQNRDGKGAFWTWGTVVMPKGQKRARWTCDLDIPLRDLENAANLPPARDTKLWAMCDIYDPVQKKYLGWGWNTRVGFRVTTSKAGKVRKVESADQPSANKLDGTEIQARLKHLKLKRGVKPYRPREAVSGRGAYFLVAGRQAYAGDPGIFEAVDTKAKARELAELRLPRCWVIKTAAQYKALKKALLGKGDFYADCGHPTSYGLTVEKMKSGSFVVRVLYYVPAEKSLYRGGVIYHQKMIISPDGGVQTRSAPALTQGWYEGWGGMPPRLSGNEGVWDQLARTVLAKSGLEVIPDRLGAK
jgi:hypothetical protein